MWAAVKLNNGTSHPYGFGWELDTVGGHKLVHHGGTLPGFRAELARFVDDKLTVIVLANGNNADPASISLGVAALYIPGLIPERTVAKVDPKIFDAYVGAIPGEWIIGCVDGHARRRQVDGATGFERRKT